MLADRVRMGRNKEKDDEEFWLDFGEGTVEPDPMFPQFQILVTDIVIVPQDCVLYLDVPYEDLKGAVILWIVNGEIEAMYDSVDGMYDDVDYVFQTGDTLRLAFRPSIKTLDYPAKVRLDNADGEIVGEFYVYAEPNCYLTTTMVNYFGKYDDGIELTSMRKLRSHSGYKYQDVLEEYAQVSPIIIQGIEQSEDRDYYYNMIKDVVDNIVIWVANEEWEKAETAYLDLYYYLKEKFGGI